MTIVFNEWAARYAADQKSFSDVLDADGKPIPDYGRQCSVYFSRLADELDAGGKLPKPPEN